MTDKISVAIVAKDNPQHLKETVNSVVDFVDEIVIFDIGLAKNVISYFQKQQKVKIKKINQKILYVEEIREKIKDCLKNSWALYLDPDEIFPIKTLLIVKKEIKNYDCFSFPRKNIIFNHWTKNSRFWPDYQTRLFNKNNVFWPKEIHSKPIISGKEYLFEAKEENAIIHYNYESINQWFEKFLRYAQVESQYCFKNKKPITLSQTIKKSLSEFISRYFSAQGYKDGTVGLTLSVLQMFYYFVVYFYYLELKKFKKEEEKDSPSKLMQNFFQSGFFETNFWLDKENLNSGVKKLKNKIINKLIKTID